jgi:hypothetical protein
MVDHVISFLYKNHDMVIDHELKLGIDSNANKTDVVRGARFKCRLELLSDLQSIIFSVHIRTIDQVCESRDRSFRLGLDIKLVSTGDSS